jgi:hypothetical protein
MQGGSEAPHVVKTGIVNDREFRQHLVKLRLARERKEAQAANAAQVKKPPRYCEVPKGEEEAVCVGWLREDSAGVRRISTRGDFTQTCPRQTKVTRLCTAAQLASDIHE